MNELIISIAVAFSGEKRAFLQRRETTADCVQEAIQMRWAWSEVQRLRRQSKASDWLKDKWLFMEESYKEDDWLRLNKIAARRRSEQLHQQQQQQQQLLMNLPCVQHLISCK